MRSSISPCIKSILRADHATRHGPASNSAMIKVITFDLDDTLWPIEPVLMQAEQRQYDWLKKHAPQLALKYSLTQLTRLRLDLYHDHPHYHHQISQVRIDATAQALCQCGYAKGQAQALAQQAFDIFLHARHQVELFNEVPTVIEQLASDYRLGVLTNGNADIYRLPIGHWFDFSFSAEQLDSSKPAVAHFEAAMASAGVAAHEIVHIGDHAEHDIEGARAAGCRAVWFNPDQLPWPFSTPAPAQVHTLASLPGVIATLSIEKED